MNTSSHRRVVD